MRQGLIERVLQRSGREETIGRGKHAVREHKHGLAHALKRFRFQTKEIKSIVRKQHQLQQVETVDLQREWTGRQHHLTLVLH